MLTRRLTRHSRSPSTLLRTLTTTSAYQRTPALGDLTPNGASAFDQRQQDFRKKIREAERAKREQDSQSSVLASSASTSPTAPYNAVLGAAPTTSAPVADESDMSDVALGSLSTHDTEAARENSQKNESSKRKGALSSLIYGTHEGQQMDQEIEKSFSQVLARGKYVHSIVLHTVKPDKVDEYVKLVGGWYPKVASTQENHVNLVGSWRTEVGDCDTFGKGYRSCKANFCHVADLLGQSTSGNTNDTTAIMPPSTPSNITLTSLHSIPNSRNSSPTSKPLSCKSSRSGQPPLHGSSAVFSNYALTLYIPATYWSGNHTGGKD